MPKSQRRIFDLVPNRMQSISNNGYPKSQWHNSLSGFIQWSKQLNFLSQLHHTFFTARCYAERGTAMASCLSVCPSLTLRYRDHIGWNSWKIISRLISLTFVSSLGRPQHHGSTPKETPQILAGIGVGGLSIFAISLKRCKIGSKLLLTTNRNMYTRSALSIGTKIDDLDSLNDL